MNYHSPILVGSINSSAAKGATKAPSKSAPTVLKSATNTRTQPSPQAMTRHTARLDAINAVITNKAGVSAEIIAVVDAHLEAWADFELFCMHYDTPQDVRGWKKLSDAEEAALFAVLSAPKATLADIAYVASYLERWNVGSDLWTRHGAGDELLKSLKNAPIAPHPDAGLIALKAAFDQSYASEQELEQRCDNGEDVGLDLDRAYAKVCKIAKRIASTRATTLDGLKIKMAAWEFCRPDDPAAPRYDIDGEGNGTTDMMILSGMMQDLHRMSGPPPSYPASHPWVAVCRLSTELSAALSLLDDGPVMALIKPATEPSPIAWGDLDIYRDMLPLKPVEIEDMGDQLQGDIDALRELVRTISWDLANLCHDHPEKPGERHTELDQVGRLVRILETVADKLVLDVDGHVTHLYGVQGANRTNFSDVQKARRVPPAEDGESALSSDLDATSSKAA